MNHLLELQKIHATNQERLSLLREQMDALAAENHKIAIAIEVLTRFDVASNSAPAVPTDSQIFKVFTGISMPDGKTSVKRLVLQELSKASPLTKMDIVSRLHGAGYRVNTSTVGSLLSKMVNEEVEKAGLTAYRLKSESPVGTGLSGATMSTAGEL